MVAIGLFILAVGVLLYLAGWTIRVVAHGRYRRGVPVSADAGHVATRLRWTGLATTIVGALLTAIAQSR